MKLFKKLNNIVRNYVNNILFLNDGEYFTSASGDYINNNITGV